MKTEAKKSITTDCSFKWYILYIVWVGCLFFETFVSLLFCTELGRSVARGQDLVIYSHTLHKEKQHLICVVDL